MLTPSSGIVAKTALELSITDKTGTAAMVRFRLDTATARLLRETITSAGGSATATRILVRAVPSSSAAVFRYYSLSGTELDPTSITPAQLVACATRVRVDLHDSAVGGPSDQTFSLQVSPRSERAEEATCP